jgi:hypothetical protein
MLKTQVVMLEMSRLDCVSAQIQAEAALSRAGTGDGFLKVVDGGQTSPSP